MAEQVEVDLIVKALAQGFQKLGDELNAQKELFKEEEDAIKKADAALKKHEKQQQENAKAAKQGGDATKYLNVQNAELAQAMLKAEDAAINLANAEKKLAEATPENQGDLAREVLQARQEMEAANKSVKGLSDTTVHFSEKFQKDMQALNDTLDVFNFAMDGASKVIDATAAAAQRLGRTEFQTALDDATKAAQSLGDAFFQLPIGKLVPAFQVLGDEELKNADAITILTRAFKGAADGAKLVNVQLIKMKAESGEISWEEATKQINELTGAMEDNRTEASKAADAVNAYAARWAGVAAATSTVADDNLAKWLATNGKEAKAAAAELASLEKTSKLLAAGLSGVVGNALSESATTMEETSKEIEKIRAEIEKYEAANGKTVTVTKEATNTQTEHLIALRDLGEAQKALNENTDPKKTLDLQLALEKAQESAKKTAEGLGTTTDVTLDYSKKIDELNLQLDEQVKKQEAVEEATKKAIAQFILQQVAASLDARGQLELAKSLGLIDQQSYATANAAMILTNQYDKNNDGVVSAAEGSDKYIESLQRLADATAQQVTPALGDNTQYLAANEAHTNMLKEEWERAIPIQQDWRQSIIDAEGSMGEAVLTGGELKATIDGIQSKEVDVITNYITNGSPPGGGGGAGGGTVSGGGGQVYAASGVDMIVPPGYPNDSFTVHAQSGERVLVQTPQQQATEGMGGGGLSIGVVNIYAQGGADGRAIAEAFSAEIARMTRVNSAAGISALRG